MTATRNTRSDSFAVSRSDFITEASEQIIARHQDNVRTLTARVETIKGAKADAVTSTRALRAVALAARDNAPATVVIDVPSREGLRMTIGDVAHQQLSNKLGIDARYYNRMIEHAPDLLATNINWWMQHEPDERLLRMLRAGPALGEDETRMMAQYGASFKLRAVLGKSYRTIDDADLVSAILPELAERGTLLQEFSIDERRMHAKFVTRAQTLERPRVRGEVVASGVYVRHSEIGYASLTASTFMLILKCTNGMIGEDAVSIRHVGKARIVGDEDVRFLKDDTQILENAALLGRVRDGIGRALLPATIAEKGERILDAKETMIERDQETPLFEFVGTLGANLGLNEANIERLKEETTKSIVEEGGETHFAFVQGITAVAREMTNYDQRTELEHVGFTLLNDDPSKLLQLATTAVQKRGRKNGNGNGNGHTNGHDIENN